MLLRNLICRTWWAVPTLLLCVVGCATAQATTQPLSQKSSVDDILDALDNAGKSMKDFVASVKLTDTDNNTGDETIHDGKVFFQKKGENDARVKIIFTTKEDGDKSYPMDHRYMLDDGKLVERDYVTRRETIRQILKPGEKMNLLKLGEGPFPLPIGQSKDDVKGQFDVTKIDPAQDDPAGTIHLQLIPKPGSSFDKKFKKLDIWVDPATAMPRRIRTLDHNETTIKTTDLTDLKLNSGLKDSDLVDPDLPAGKWETVDEPYGD